MPKFIEKYVSFNAITLPPIGMFFKAENFVESTIKHELIHWEQYKRFGFIGFYFAYLILTAKFGYWNNPMEVEAYEANQ